jgi:oxygen-dependent protoporphyrinogen oxidase
VVVVGAGIAGLAAASAVRRDRPDADLVVLEASGEVGGKLRVAEVGGLTVDVGAESMLNRRPEAVALARAAGLEGQLTHPATIAAQVWSRGRMHRLPRSVLGVPADIDELAGSGLLSLEGLDRARDDLTLPATVLDADMSVGDLVQQRLGPEVVDRLVEPLLGGVYAGHAREISARAATPQVLALLQRHPSLMLAAAEATAIPADVPVFAGLVGGVGQLPGALVSGGGTALPLEVRLHTTVRELVRLENGWRLVTGPASAPQQLTADAVVVAAPPANAARLLGEVAPVAAGELAQVEQASMAVVTIAFPARSFPEVVGSGFLVPPVDGGHVKAATYSFAKWGWVRDLSDDMLVVRTSIGRHREEQQLQVTDEELVRRSLTDLRNAVGLVPEPVDWLVTRWGGGLPQYAVGHLDRVRRVREAVAAAPGLAVCGAAYDGIGIPACIASAELAARQVLDHLPDPGRPPVWPGGTMAP